METNLAIELPAAVQSAFTQSNQNDVALVPYAKVGEEWTLPDHVVLSFGKRAMDEGVLETVFIDGSVRNPFALLRMMQTPTHIPVFVVKDSTPVGLAWLNNCSGSHAFGHFMFLREGRGAFARSAGRLILQYWNAFRVGDDPLFSVILGLVPSQNAQAVQYAQDIGLVRVGKIPKIVAGQSAELLYFVR